MDITYRRTPEYGLWRRKVWHRDEYRCRICGKEKHIQAHHIFPWRSHSEERYNLDNGITLCRYHHGLVNKKELLAVDFFRAILANGVNSVKLPSGKAGDNTEPSRERNLAEGVTTRNRDFHIEQFSKKQVKCKFCGKPKMVYYYRTLRSKSFICGKKKCRRMLLGDRLTGENHPRWHPAIINKCLWCGKNTNTPSDKNRAKKFCNNTCQMAHWNNQVGWSREHKKCVVCDTTETKHKGNGMCQTCHRANRYKVSNVSKSAPPERDDIV